MKKNVSANSNYEHLDCSKEDELLFIFRTTKCYLFFLFFLFSFNKSWSQQNAVVDQLKIGERCPDFNLNDVISYKKKQATLKDFSGKWLILDFWNQYCGACISSFPRNNELQKQFSDKNVQFLLVGYTGSQYTHHSDNLSIRALYSKIQAKENLILPVAFDSILFSTFDVGACPHLIIIDDKGIVRAVTTEINADNLKDFIDGKSPTLPKTYLSWNDKKENNLVSYSDTSTPFFPNFSVLYGTALSKWNNSLPQIIHRDINPYIEDGKFFVQGVPLYWLYNYAFIGKAFWNPSDDSLYGKYASHPVLDLSDSLLFNFDFGKQRHIFNYSLFVPSHRFSLKTFQEVMRKDLSLAFGYTAKLEYRNCSYWSLTATNWGRNKLKSTNSTTSYSSIPHLGFKAMNYPLKNLVYLLWENYQDDIFIDETEIKGNVDLILDCNLTDFDNVCKALRKSGLDLVRKQMRMKAIVISHKSESTQNNSETLTFCR